MKKEKIKQELYTVQQLAEKSGYAVNTVWAYLGKGKIKPTEKRDGRNVYGEDALQAVLSHRRVPGAVGTKENVICPHCLAVRSRARMLRDAHATKKNGDKVTKCKETECGKDIVIEILAAGRPFGHHTKWAKNQGK